MHISCAQVLSVLPKLLLCSVSAFTAVRHMAARCISVMATANVHSVMKVSVCMFVLIYNSYCTMKACVYLGIILGDHC